MIGGTGKQVGILPAPACFPACYLLGLDWQIPVNAGKAAQQAAGAM